MMTTRIATEWRHEWRQACDMLVLRWATLIAGPTATNEERQIEPRRTRRIAEEEEQQTPRSSALSAVKYKHRQVQEAMLGCNRMAK
jgi:hypothetical protein